MSRPQDIFANVLGQTVDVSHPNTASGVYFASDAAVEAMNESGTNLCPSGMRPTRVVIKGLDFEGKNYILGCNGQISQEDMPDVRVVDWPYRIYIDLLLVLLVVALATGITFKLLR